MSAASELLNDLSEEVLWRIEATCCRFEKLWREGKRPCLNEFIAVENEGERIALLRELLRLDVYYRRELQEEVSEQNYTIYYTDAAAVLGELFPGSSQPPTPPLDQPDVTISVNQTPEASSSPRRPPNAELHQLSTDPGVGDIGIEPPSPKSNSTATSHANNRFQVVRFHAQGGIGRVFVAEDQELHRQVALKELKQAYAGHADSRNRFVLEAEITGNLEHPGIVPVYGMGKYPNGLPYYAMRFIKGDTLLVTIQRFHEKTPTRFDCLDFRHLLGHLVAACQAVAYAHSRGVLHRDLKPANIMVGKYGETLVVDWGMAKVLGTADSDSCSPSEETVLQPLGRRHADTVGVVGTPAYMSPEQAQGVIAELRPTTDVYSLGATLYTILTNKPPFQGQGLEVVPQVSQGKWSPPRQVQPLVPVSLDAICRKAMALLPKDRYLTPLELSVDLERWLGDEPVSATREPVPVKVRRWMRKHPRTVTSITAILLAAILGLTVGAFVLDYYKRVAEGNFVLTREAARTFLVSVNDDTLLNEPGMQPLRYKLLEKALDYYQEFLKKQPGDLSVRAEKADATRRLGEVYLALGRFKEADARLQGAVNEYTELLRASQVPEEWRIGFAQALLASTDFHLQKKDFSPAQEAVTRAIAELEVLRLQRPGEPKLLTLLGRALDVRAVVLSEMGLLDKAIEDNARSGVILFSSLLATIADNPGAKPAFHELTIFDRNAEDFGTSYLLFRAWSNQGRLQHRVGKPAVAFASFQTAANMAHIMQAKHRFLHPRSVRLRIGLASVQLHAARAALDLGLPSRALPLLQEAIDLAKFAVDDLPAQMSYEPQTILAQALASKAEALFLRGQESQAASLLQFAQTQLLDLVPTDSGASPLAEHAHILWLCGQLETDRGNPTRALTLCEEAVSEQANALRLRPWDRKLKVQWIRTRRSIAHLRHDTGKDNQATLIQTLRLLHAELKTLASAPPVLPSFQREVGSVTVELARALTEAGQAPAALVLLDETLTQHKVLTLNDDLGYRLRSFKPLPAELDPLHGNQKLKVTDLEKIGLPKNFWTRHPTNEPEDLQLKKIEADLLATKATTLAALGFADKAKQVATESLTIAQRLVHGPTYLPSFSASKSSPWLTIANIVASREPGYLYDLACHQASSASLHGHAPDLAVQTLQRLALTGFDHSAKLRTDPRLKTLRPRADFRTLLDSLDKQPR